MPKKVRGWLATTLLRILARILEMRKMEANIQVKVKMEVDMSSMERKQHVDSMCLAPFRVTKKPELSGGTWGDLSLGDCPSLGNEVATANLPRALAVSRLAMSNHA
jgi:hypothetical protein